MIGLSCGGTLCVGGTQSDTVREANSLNRSAPMRNASVLPGAPVQRQPPQPLGVPHEEERDGGPPAGGAVELVCLLGHAAEIRRQRGGWSGFQTCGYQHTRRQMKTIQKFQKFQKKPQ